jgi:hypothetical protein
MTPFHLWTLLFASAAQESTPFVLRQTIAISADNEGTQRAEPTCLTTCTPQATAALLHRGAFEWCGL